MENILPMKKLFLPLLLLASLLQAVNVNSQTNYSSYSSATATIYLDFDGEDVYSPIWNRGVALKCTPAVLNDTQIQEIFNRVAEDFRPFNINITTSESVFVAAPLNKRIRVIVTSTSAWFTGVGGIAYVGSFNWGDDTPCFVFSDRLGNSPKMVAECCSHESGHTLGLSHQSKYDGSCNLTDTYNAGSGTGEVSWAPIMGNSYSRNMSSWNNGPTPYGCSKIQDNLSIITTQNNITYRVDDFGDNIHTDPTVITSSVINIDGLISSTNDKDAFKFTLARNENFRLTVTPFSVSKGNDGANLDVRLSLYNDNKTLLRTYNPANTMAVAVDTVLNAGTYYMVVDGAGNNYTSSYGSLGSYKIAGLMGVLSSCKIQLSGISEKNNHRLQWGVACNEQVRTTSIQTSDDGIHYNTIHTVNGTTHSFAYAPFVTTDLYYRLKTTTVSDQIAYSNTIFLKKTGKSISDFKVSTFVQQAITVNAATNFQYQLSDANGNKLMMGTANAGFSNINMSQFPQGIYILQLMSSKGGNGLQQTERIVKN